MRVLPAPAPHLRALTPLTPPRKQTPVTPAPPPSHPAPPYTAALAQAQVERAAAIANGVPVHRGSGETVGVLVGVILSLPCDFAVMQPARLLLELTTSLWDAVGDGRKRGGFLGAFCTCLLPFAALLYALAIAFQRFATVIETPFVALRGLTSSIGRALSPERVCATAHATYRRVSPHGWPHLPVNAATGAAIARYRRGVHTGADVMIVPGFTSDSETHSLSETAQARLRDTIADWHNGRAPFILVSGGNVHPTGTVYNEAFEMRAYLLAHGIPENAILVEPFAAHTHTNVRNAGRMMRQLGLERAALIVSSSTPLIGQSRTFAMASSLGGGVDIRSHLDTGVGFGTFLALDTAHTLYSASPDVDLVSLPLDPTDP